MRMVKVCSPPPACRAASWATTEESTPPDRNTPSGTSLRRRKWTDSDTSARVRSTASA